MRLLVHNQKGGVGKTTTAANLGAALLREGLADAVTLVDLDPQMHLTAMLSPEGVATGATASDWLAGQATGGMPVPTEPGLRLVPGDVQDRAGTVIALPAGHAQDGWTIVDSAPGWTPLAQDLCRWADLILCPFEPDFLGLSGVSRLLTRLDGIGVGRERIRFLPCRHNPRLALHRDVCARLADRFGPALLLPLTIRSTIRIAEAPGFGCTVLHHAPGSTGCKDYRRLARAIAATGPTNGLTLAQAPQDGQPPNGRTAA